MLLAEVLVDEADEARQLPLLVEVVNVAFLGKAAYTSVRVCAAYVQSERAHVRYCVWELSNVTSVGTLTHTLYSPRIG